MGEVVVIKEVCAFLAVVDLPTATSVRQYVLAPVPPSQLGSALGRAPTFCGEDNKNKTANPTDCDPVKESEGVGFRDFDS
jgi:hypothetical protein